MIASREGERDRFARYSELILPLQVLWRGTCFAALLVAAMPIDPFLQPGAFEPETIAVMSEVFDAACETPSDTSQPEVAREIIAMRIIAAARLGGRDPLRLREAALRK